MIDDAYTSEKKKLIHKSVAKFSILIEFFLMQ